MRSRRHLKHGIAAALILAAAIATAGRAQAPVRIRLGTLVPQGSSYHRILQQMGEQWRQTTNGQVQLTVYAGTMGSEIEMVRRMRLGQLQAAAITVTGLKEIDPATAALEEMPMMYRSLDEVSWVRSRLEPIINRRLADRGFIVLFWTDAGWVRWFSRRPATRPDDFKPMKIFVTAGDAWHADELRSLGYSPVPLEWSDVLTALRTGMIDAVPTVPYFALSLQIYTVARYMLEVPWVPLAGATVVTRSTWDALTPAQQEALRSAAVDAGKAFLDRGRAEADEAVKAMQERGLTVVPLPPAAAAEWRTVSERIYPQLRGGNVPADMFDEVVRLLGEYRRAHPGS